MGLSQVMDLVAHQTEALWSPSSGYNKLFVLRDEVFNFAFFPDCRPGPCQELGTCVAVYCV